MSEKLAGFDKARFDKLVDAAVAAERAHAATMRAHEKTGEALNDAWAALSAAREKLKLEVENMVRETVLIGLSREDTSPCNAPLMSSRTKKCVLQAGHAGAHEFPKYAE